MDTTRLEEGKDELLRHMERVGYSASHIDCVRREVDWLCANHDAFDTYEEALDLRAPRDGNSHTRRDHCTTIGICKHFDLDGEMPEFGRGHMLLDHGAHHLLRGEFADVIEVFRRDGEGCGLSEKSVSTYSSAASNFLLAMQEMGRGSLSEVTERDVLSRFSGGRQNEAKGLVRVLRSGLGAHSAEAERIASLVPRRREARENVDYLRPDEVEAIREALRDEASDISVRDRAIVTTLFYTGLRASDVAGLRLADIDWEADEIRVTQAKTAVPLVLPLTARVGNAIYDYLEEGRPEGDDPHVFLSERRPHGPIYTRIVYYAVGRVMDAAGVRVGDGRRRGSHLFRHNVATTIVGSGMQPIFATAALGQVDPGTVDRYLHADIEHLRECALDVSAFGLGEGAFDV